MIAQLSLVLDLQALDHERRLGAPLRAGQDPCFFVSGMERARGPDSNPVSVKTTCERSVRVLRRPPEWPGRGGYGALVDDSMPSAVAAYYGSSTVMREPFLGRVLKGHGTWLILVLPLGRS